MEKMVEKVQILQIVWILYIKKSLSIWHIYCFASLSKTSAWDIMYVRHVMDTLYIANIQITVFIKILELQYKYIDYHKKGVFKKI